VAPQNLESNSAQLLERMIDASVDGIFAFDRDCRLIAWNRAMQQICGLSRDEVLGKCVIDVFPFLREGDKDSYFSAALAGQELITESHPYAETGVFESRYSPLLDEQNNVTGVIAVIGDISARKQAEEATRRLEFHVESSPLAVVEWDSDFRVSRWSASAEGLFGWKAEDVLGKHVNEWRFVFTDDVDAVALVTNRQREGVEVQGVTRNRNYTREGSILYCEWYNSVLRDERGKLVSVLSLVLDVTARQSAEEERAASLVRERDARQHAEEADRLKDEFLATLSHELRTPLTSILGWASMIRNGEVEGSNASRAIETIERNARSQARLIDDLLDVSRIITGNLRLDLHPLNLAPIVEAALDALRPTADVKGMKLQTRFVPGQCLVKGDPNRLRQVIWNLLSNAIKFTPRHGSVSIDLTCVESTARLTVSDTGEGISPEFLPYVFDRFRQAEGSISRKQGGLGLGLAVARHLVELHGGTIRAESKGIGKGAVFSVDLPLAQERRDPARSEERRREVERRRSRMGAVRLDGVHVLLVEDDDDSRKLLGTMLKRNGARVTSTKSAAEALAVFEGELPDVLISDIGMPDQDGYELMRKLRALPPQRGGKTPAIALTGYASRKDRDRALNSGYQQHMAKPIEQADMIKAIAALVGRGD
ncbi:MAG TPA: PAS domain S-box protein, partial [Pyrinomonadaceae bacterium]|nr:PAS domain S-box protein [Pyrinomonadaceae bacterium]